MADTVGPPTSAEELPLPERPVRTTRRRILWIIVQIVAIGFALHFLWVNFSGYAEVGRSLARGNLVMLLLVLLFEACSLTAYGELVYQVLRSMGEAPRRNLIQRTNLAGTSLGKTLPGGTTTALAVSVNVLRGAGLSGSRTTAALATSGMLSSFTLALLLPVAVVVAMLGGHRGGIALSAGVASIALIAILLFLRKAVNHPAGFAAVVTRMLERIARGPLRTRIDPQAIGVEVEKAIAGVREILHNRRALRRALACTSANWLFDVAALTAVAVTVGRGVPLTGILLAYVIGQLACAIPLTPGGLGVMETAMIAALVATGSPAAAATATVLGWRIVSFWLPILVGMCVLPTLRARRAPTALNGS
ncbi:MAG: lysylphosphatidylglycerol synthase transmembrane domain-containing protein [Acidimicrobiia bacterium]